MANKKQKTGKKLLLYKEVTVNSRAYGAHTRAARLLQWEKFEKERKLFELCCS